MKLRIAATRGKMMTRPIATSDAIIGRLTSAASPTGTR